MKKILVSFFSLLLLVSMSVPAFAASNSDAILDALRSGIVVDGKTVEIPANYINQAENYFSSHQVTDAQANYLLAQINSAKKAIQASGVTNLSKLDAGTKQKILSEVQSAANSVDLKLTIGSNKTVQIADPNGSIVFAGGNPIKTTGLQINWTSGIFSILLLMTGVASVCGYLIYKNKLLEH